MNISAPFVRRPVMTIFVMLSVFLGGIFSYVYLPVSDLPAVEHPHMEIVTGFTGASAHSVLHLVTIPLEKELVHISGVQEISSQSSQGSSIIYLKFALDQNMDRAIRDVSAALSRAEYSLPKEIDSRPTFHLQKESQDPIGFMILTSKKEGDKGDLRVMAENYIVPRISRIPGVAKVSTFGRSRSLWVRINPELLAARGIGFDQVVDTLRQNSLELPLGTIQSGNKNLAIELEGSAGEITDIENISIGSLKIKDIAEVSDTVENQPHFLFSANGISRPALIMSIQKVSDGNTVAIAESVQRVINNLKVELPPYVEINLWFNKATWIEESLFDVEWSLFFAFVLVGLIVYVSLGRLLEAFIISMALPLSLLGTLVVIYLLGFSLNLLSLLALTLSVGFVVDDAIVVLENIVRHKEAKKNAFRAALEGSAEISFTILSMTVSLIAVFIPLLFMEGMNGRLFKEFSMTLAIAIGVSGFVSLTLTPMLCSVLLKDRSITKLEQSVNEINAKLIGLYEVSLRALIEHKKKILVCVACLVCFAVPLFKSIPVSLVPAEDRSYIFSLVRLPQGLSNQELTHFRNRLDDLLHQEEAIESFVDISFSGFVKYLIHLKSQEIRGSIEKVMERLQAKFDDIAGIQSFLKPYQLINLEMDLGSGGQYELLIRGGEFTDVQKAAADVAMRLNREGLVQFARPTQQNDSPKLVVQVDEQMAHQLGITKGRVQNLLQQAYGQGLVGKVHRKDQSISLFIDLQTPYKNHVNGLSKLYFTGQDGTMIPFKSLATSKVVLSAPHLERNEQLAASSILFTLKPDADPVPTLEKIEKLAREELLEGLHAELHGAAKNVTKALWSTLILLLGATAVMYIVLGILYESFLHPLTILSSLPIAALGGILTLTLFQEPISVFSSVGFLLLIGIVKKNGIMMVDYALEMKDKGAKEAIIQAALVRFRPIMMTTLAAVMGALPIAIGFGAGSTMHRGLGLVIVGGLLFAQVLTLYVTPMIYLLFEGLRGSKGKEVSRTGRPLLQGTA